MFEVLKKWLGIGEADKWKRSDSTEMITSQDYNMAQSFSGDDIGVSVLPSVIVCSSV